MRNKNDETPWGKPRGFTTDRSNYKMTNTYFSNLLTLFCYIRMYIGVYLFKGEIYEV